MLAPLALIPWKSILTLGVSSILAEKGTDLANRLATRDNIKGLARTFGALRGQSIGESAALGLISPMVLIEDSLMHQPYMTELMTVINMRDMRDALSHISYQGQIGGINITKLIAEVNPNAAAAGFLSYDDQSASELCYSGCENFGWAEHTGQEAVAYGSRGPERSVGRIMSTHLSDVKDQVLPDSPPQGSKARVKAQDDLSVYSPLAVGRTVNAQIRVGQDESSFPLTFRQIPVPVDKTSLELLFSAIKGGVGFTARFKDRAAGAITYPELIGGADDIRNEFRIRNNDLSGFYTEANKRGSANLVAALTSGNISLNTQANTIILSKETADQIELQNGIRFNSGSMSKVRKALKANTIVIVNDARGIFEFLTPVSALSEKYTEAQIKLKSAKEDSASSLESLVKLLNGR